MNRRVLTTHSILYSIITLFTLFVTTGELRGATDESDDSRVGPDEAGAAVAAASSVASVECSCRRYRWRLQWLAAARR